MDYNSIKRRIVQFQSNDNLDEDIYNKIFNDLDKLYNIKNNSYNIFTSNQYILKEKEIFKKYLMARLLNKAIEEAKLKHYEIGLNYIKQLTKLNPPQDYLEKMDKLEQYCNWNMNLNKGKELIENKDFKKAIQFYKNMKETAANIEENESFSQGLELAKYKYFIYLNEEVINLMPKKLEKHCIKKCEDVIAKCEYIFKEFQCEKKLKNKISDIKNQIYRIVLEKAIEEKADQNQDYSNEINKYKKLIETDNLEKDVLENFLVKIINKFNSKDKRKNEARRKKNKILNAIDSSEISLEIVDYYLDIIKNINEGDLKEIEAEIKEQIINYNKEIHKSHDDIQDWIESNKNNIKNNKFRGNVFAVFNIVNEEIFKFSIRPIQLIALLFMTKSGSKLGGIFLQINTGEGKSLIIQFLAAYLALLGNKVDVISSSTVLADRDGNDEDFKKFYEKFGLTSGCASKEEYKEDIVYGDTQNFEAGILREEFKEKQIRFKRPFNCVIIDEVDSISLDNIISMTQLTDNFPGRSCYHFFYYQILICFCQILSESPEITEMKGYKEIIHDKIKNMLSGKILDKDGKLIEKDTPIIYPKSMKGSSIEESIEPWIDSVIRAFSMVKNRDFIIKDNIVPVDYSNTGVLQNNMTWDRGLHQFLQIRFNAKATFENENTNFLSNISFFRRYNGNLYGVTGTFGGSNFQYILKTVYNISLYKIPPNKTSLLEDWGGFVYTDEKSYLKKIFDNIKQVIQKNRSVLLICNSIVKGKEFLNLLHDEYKDNMMKYFTEEDENTVKNILSPRKIIVATNLAGRGTDIKISDELEKNGGLHVLVTFLPLNQRIEEQNYGKAGRKGQKGSHMLVMLYKNEYGYFEKEELNVENIKQKRDKIELESIKYLIDNEMSFILEKELLFKDFCHFLNVECQNFNSYEKLNLEEKWAKILKSENIEEIKKNYELLKKDKNKKLIKNILIKLKDIINYADNAGSFPVKLLESEYEYSWVARMKYACLLAKEKAGKLQKTFHYQEKAIIEFNETKKIIDIFISNLDSLNSLNKLVFGFLKENEEKLKDKDFKTEIEKQNDKIKLFLETIKILIDENLETIQKYIQENKPNNPIELDKLLTIEDIINIGKELKIEDKPDIKLYMSEFGFKNFEVLIIKKNKKYIGNIIVITVGVMQVCLGAVILMYASTPIMFKFARYLIKEGIKDIIKGVKATIDGEEINLKSFALEKGLSLVGFALDLAIGGPITIENSIKDRIFSIVKEECTHLVKNYANKYIANKIVKKIICMVQDKLKSFILAPLMDKMTFSGKEIDKGIQYDMIYGKEDFKELIINNCEKIFEQMDGIIDFLGPLIDLAKVLKCNGRDEKLAEFLTFLSNIDYQGLNTMKNNIKSILKNEEYGKDLDNNLSTLIKALDPSLSEEKVDEICIELIECGVINKKGELDKKFNKLKSFEQCFQLNIDEKYMKYEYNNNRKISNELQEKLNLIYAKVNKTNLLNRKEEIKNEMYEKFENFIQSIIERVLEIIEDKASEKLEKLWNKYKNKTNKLKGELDNEDDYGEKKKKKANDEDENDDVKIVKKSNVNPNGEEEANFPELNDEAIKKSKKKKEGEDDDDQNAAFSSKKYEEKKAKNKATKEKSLALVNEKNYNLFFKGASSFVLKQGVQIGINNVIIPKLIDILSNYFKEKLKTKLMPDIFDRLDWFFERFGEHVIKIGQKLPIKKILNTLIKSIRYGFRIIIGIKIFVTPILKSYINKIKKGTETHTIIIGLNQELISKLDQKIIIPFKNFVNSIFGEKGSTESYKLFERIIEEGYQNVRAYGIEKYEDIKQITSEKYEKYKNVYLEKRKKITDLPDEIYNKYQQKKQELKNKYEQYKRKIIESTDIQIKKLEAMDINTEFKKIAEYVRSIIIDKMNALKQEIKNKIEDIASKIPNYFNDFNELIDKVLNLKFETYKEHKIVVLKHILNFFLEVETGKIKLEEKNEQGIEIRKDGKDLLLKYISDKLGMKCINIKEIIEFLFKNGLESLLIKRMNKIIKYSQKKFDQILKKYYEPFSKLIKGIIEILKEDVVDILEKEKEKNNEKIDSIFDFFIKYINKFFNKINVSEFFDFKIEIDDSCKKELINTLKKFRDLTISKISKSLEDLMNKIDKKCDEKINKIKNLCSDKINGIVDKYENKFFGYINNKLIEEDQNNKKIKKSNTINNKLPEGKTEDKKEDNKISKKEEKKEDKTEDNKYESNNYLFDINYPNISIKKKDSDEDEYLSELYDIVNKDIIEKDLKYNVKRTNYYNENYYDLNESDSLEKLVDQVDKDIKEKDKKYGIVKNEDNNENYYDSDERDSLEKLVDQVDKDIKEKDKKYGIVKNEDNNENYYDSDESDNLEKLVDEADKDIKEKDKKYNIVKIGDKNENYCDSEKDKHLEKLMDKPDKDIKEKDKIYNYKNKNNYKENIYNSKKGQNFGKLYDKINKETKEKDIKYNNKKNSNEEDGRYVTQYDSEDEEYFSDEYDIWDVEIQRKNFKGKGKAKGNKKKAKNKDKNKNVTLDEINKIKEKKTLGTDLNYIKKISNEINVINEKYVLDDKKDMNEINYIKNIEIIENAPNKKKKKKKKKNNKILRNQSQENKNEINVGNNVNNKGKKRKDKINNKKKYKNELDLTANNTEILTLKKDNIFQISGEIVDKKNQKNKKKKNLRESQKIKKGEKDKKSNEEKEENKEKKKKCSEFERFDKNIGKIVDKKIRKNASELEQKMITYVKNSNARKFIQKKLSGNMSRQMLDKVITSMENIKEKEIQFLNSNIVENAFGKVDKYAKEYLVNKKAENVINFIDKFDAEKYNKYADKAQKYVNLLDAKTKEEFRDNAKKLLQEEIYEQYEKHLEPILKELAINIGREIVNKIGDKISKKKK